MIEEERRFVGNPGILESLEATAGVTSEMFVVGGARLRLQAMKSITSRLRQTVAGFELEVVFDSPWTEV